MQSAAPAPNLIPVPEPVRPISSVSGIQSVVRPLSSPATSVQATLSKGLIVRGEITGTESLFVDGRIEGSINLPSECVTVGQNGQVLANMSASMNVCITAREIVVMGKISGNVAAERVEVRSEGVLTGNISTARISIADGAFFKGSIDIHKSDGKPAADKTPPGTPKLV